jgi:transposase, IS30 family
VLFRSSSGYVVSIVERRSGYTVLGKVASKHAEGVTTKTLDLLDALKALVRTITADNGKEFSDHASMAAGLQASICFAHPYHLWERGYNENANGMVRQYLPKQRSSTDLTDQECRDIMGRLNSRPRKRLEWDTPAEVFTRRTGVALLD